MRGSLPALAHAAVLLVAEEDAKARVLGYSGLRGLGPCDIRAFIWMYLRVGRPMKSAARGAVTC